MEVDGHIPAIIARVLEEFPNVFCEPKELPRHREYDHTITLLPDAAVVNSRPYKYSPLHKDKIETPTDKSHLNQYKPLCFSYFVGAEEGWNMEILCGLQEAQLHHSKNQVTYASN
jgi:hypothetical protein